VKYLPVVLILLLLGGAILYTSRMRRRAAEQDVGLRERLRVGSRVMTTSGLYGVIRSIDERQDTVALEIAAGVTVTWARAALRDAESLPDRYRDAAADPPTADGDGVAPR
jgi:preprotein translocase subunit YajC